ncbi:MAG: multicopper oxidase family protein [Candidatus Nanopelagicales bacterium]
MTEHSLTRREFLAALLGVAGAAGLAGCAGAQEVGAGPVVTSRNLTSVALGARLRARAVDVDLGGRTVSTWAYGDTVPGIPLRVTAGDRVRVEVANELPVETSVHWHGLAIGNDMDGVPGLTTPAIAPGGRFTYDFVVSDPGTHWFHPHTGLQLDSGLYAPLIVDDPREPGRYDKEWIVVLDDWTDGVGPSADQIFARLTQSAPESGDGMPMGRMDHGMGMVDGGDVDYPLLLVNGRPPSDPEVLRVKPGDRVRIRIINAGADTVFTVAIGGHRLRVTHSDGYPVQPLETSAVRIGMGERYDVIVKVADGVFPLVAQPHGKPGYARALIRSGTGNVPDTARPSELDTYPADVSALRATPGAVLPGRDPDITEDIILSGSMAPYRWTINGAVYGDARPLTVRPGQSMRLRLSNMSMMSHPIHLHGHSFQVGAAGGSGPRKDTILIPPMAAVGVDLAADNPGRWMLHCHNAYHAEAGMMTRLEYTA